MSGWRDLLPGSRTRAGTDIGTSTSTSTMDVPVRVQASTTGVQAYTRDTGTGTGTGTGTETGTGTGTRQSSYTSFTNSYASPPSPTVRDASHLRLNDGERIDFALQETPIEAASEYVAAFTSHQSYFHNPDIARFIVRKVTPGDIKHAPPVIDNSIDSPSIDKELGVVPGIIRL